MKGLFAKNGERFKGIMLTIEGLASEKTVERTGVPPVSPKEAEQFLRILPGWSITDRAISKEYHFESYLAGLNFAYAIGKLAEEKDHHPDIVIKWRRVRLSLSTHSIGGLSENDFIVAAGSELLYTQTAQN